MTRVSAPSRLHFGLFHVPPGGTPGDEESGTEVRCFGGVGLMIEQPGTVVTVQRSAGWQVEGMLASRAQLFAQRFMATLPTQDHGGFQILIERCPPEHVGLGVGTQLGLTIARALAVEVGLSTLTAVDLAKRIGRGERSAVGVHGFDHGGLIIEAGKRPHEPVSPLLHAETLPASWRVVIAIPPASSRWHGERERTAFEHVPPRDDIAHGERLMRLALQELKPAANRGDHATFSEVLHEFNRLAGEPFTAAQGGTYATPEVASLVAFLRSHGVPGAGQSSWGPAVFGIVESDVEASLLLSRLRSHRPEVQAFASRVNASGAHHHSVAPVGH